MVAAGSSLNPLSAVSVVADQYIGAEGDPLGEVTAGLGGEDQIWPGVEYYNPNAPKKHMKSVAVGAMGSVDAEDGAFRGT